MKIRLYREFTGPQLKKWIDEHFYTNIDDLKVKEDTVGGMFGDYIEIGGYKFKRIYGNYICMATPTESHEKPKINIIKAKTDSLNYK